MNDTIFNSRQEQILKLLKEKGNLSRSNLAEQVISKKGNSRITFIRDLRSLMKAGYVIAEGKGRAITYRLVAKNPCLDYIDLQKYFLINQEKRNTSIQFHGGVYKNLSNLYSKGEIEL